jgi:hypothetical protein
MYLNITKLTNLSMNISSEDLKCPITKCYFREPVVAEDGFTYEKKEIQRWFTKNKSSPCTNIELTHPNLHDNIFMKQTVDAYLKQHPDELQNQYAIDVTSFEQLKQMDTIKLSLVESDNLNKILSEISEDELHFLINHIDDSDGSHSLLLSLICKNSTISIVKNIITFYDDNNMKITGVDSTYGHDMIFNLCLNKNMTMELFDYCVDIYNNYKNAFDSLALNKCNILHILSDNSEPNEKLLIHVFDIFLDKKKLCDVDKNAMTALHFIFQNPNITNETLKYILSSCITNNIDINVKNIDGIKPIHYLCMNSTTTPDMMKNIIDFHSQNNWDVIVPDTSKFGPACLMFIICENINADDEIIRYVIDYSVKNNFTLNESTSKKNKLIHFLCRNNKVSDDTIMYVIDHNIENTYDIDEKNVEGWTPFNCACLYSSQKIISYFMSKNVDCLSTVKNGQGYLDIYTLMKNNSKVNKNKTTEPSQLTDLMNIIMGGINNALGVESTADTTEDADEDEDVDEDENADENDADENDDDENADDENADENNDVHVNVIPENKIKITLRMTTYVDESIQTNEPTQTNEEQINEPTHANEPTQTNEEQINEPTHANEPTQTNEEQIDSLDNLMNNK